MRIDNAFCVVSILGNSIFSNTALGIDLAGDEVTANDHCDGDTGPNNFQNYPVITSASASGCSVTLSGTLDSVANSAFRLEFFSSAACDPSGFGEGQAFLSSTDVVTDGDCNASFGPLMFPLPTGHTVVTATATSWMSVAISALKLRSSAMAVTKVSRPTRLDFHLARGNQRQPQRIYFRQSAGTRRCSGRNCARRSAICNLTIVHVSIGHFIHSDVCRGLAQRSRGTDH